MSYNSPSANRRIIISGDELIPDADFLREYYGGATKRTGARLDTQGLPYVMINGVKWRPIEECRRWLATRIVRHKCEEIAA